MEDTMPIRKTDTLTPIGEVVKVVVPESVLKKRKREEEWALTKKQGLEATKKKNAENRKLIYKKSKQYTKEYVEKDNELVQLKHEARLKGGFYAEEDSMLSQSLSFCLSFVYVVSMPLIQR